jgi:ribonucleoside-diphosphate reductase alpha chain
MASSKLQLPPNVQTVLEAHYLRVNEGKVCELPEQFYRRIARAVTAAEGKYRHKAFAQKLREKYNTPFWTVAQTKEFAQHIKNDKEIKQIEEAFYNLLISRDFVPSSTILFNVGKKNPQCAASVVVALEDSMDSIFDAIRRAATIQQSGAGLGINFSQLRPKGDILKSNNGTASGPLSYMRVFDATTAAITKGGKKRGANSGVLTIDHPDIREFITAKQHGELAHFNTYVALTEKFMKAVEKETSYILVNPRTGKVTHKESAKEIFYLLCEAIRLCGNPGIIFVDNIEKRNTLPKLGTPDAVTTTGEAALFPEENCVMGSINCAQMITDNVIDWEKIKLRVYQAVHFLDNVIDVSLNDNGNRKIGLGVMGWADMLAQLRVRYNSEKAFKLAEELMQFINSEAKSASVALAEKRGVFPNFRKSSYSKKKEDRVRNATRTLIAPTRLTSALADCNPGIEPYYGVAYERSIGKATIHETNRYFVQALRDEELYSSELMKKVRRQGTLKGLFIPVWTKRVFTTASEISGAAHLAMQTAFQRHCDNGVAKVILLPADTTHGDVSQLIKNAFDAGCISFTAYRNAGRQEHALAYGLGKTVYTGNMCPSCDIPLEREAQAELCRVCGYGIIE